MCDFSIICSREGRGYGAGGDAADSDDDGAVVGVSSVIGFAMAVAGVVSVDTEVAVGAGQV